MPTTIPINHVTKATKIAPMFGVLEFGSMVIRKTKHPNRTESVQISIIQPASISLLPFYYSVGG